MQTKYVSLRAYWWLKTKCVKKKDRRWRKKITTDKVNLHIIGRWCGIFSVWPQHIADCSRFSIVISMMHDAQIVHKSNWILLNGSITTGTNHQAVANILIGSCKARRNSVKCSWSNNKKEEGKRETNKTKKICD